MDEELMVQTALKEILSYLFHLIDEGETLDLDETIGACDEGVSSFLKENLDVPGVLFEGQEETISRIFSNFGINTEGEVRRKYNVEHNGLCYLAAAIVDLICNGYIQYL